MILIKYYWSATGTRIKRKKKFSSIYLSIAKTTFEKNDKYYIDINKDFIGDADSVYKDIFQVNRGFRDKNDFDELSVDDVVITFLLAREIAKESKL